MSSQKQNDRYIRATEYAKKHGFEYAKFRLRLTKGEFIAEKRSEYDPISKRHTKRWYVFDAPPADHPNYVEQITKPLTMEGRRSKQNYDARFTELAPEFLRRFQQNSDPGKSTFTQSELATILETTPVSVAKWATDGLTGFGQLPRLKIPDDVQSVKPSQRIYYYHRLHIVAFLKGECTPGNKRKKTIDDALVQADEASVAREHGYFVYDRNKVYPMTYEGFLKWIEENVYREDKKLKKWVPFVPNEIQREFYKEVFRLKPDGTLRHRFIRLSRPRGDFKSFDTVLVFLFRFFNMPREKILLAANSKDQSDFALFQIARDIIFNSPKLAEMANTLALEVKEKEIVLMEGKKRVFSIIKPIASKIGTLSNATCICFSEIYKCRDEDFIIELEGSIRAVTNGMTIIESTVSPKDHYFYREYTAYLEGTHPDLYFQYYNSKHYNPDMTESELAKYKATMKPGDFNRFFINRWEDAAYGLFTAREMLETSFMGINEKDGPRMGPSPSFKKCLEDLVDLNAKLLRLDGSDAARGIFAKIRELESQLVKVDDIYTLPASLESLQKLQDIFECEFTIGIGLDRAKQLAKRSDRSAMVTIAKGVLDVYTRMYFVLDIFMPRQSKLSLFAERILWVNETFGWVSNIELEEYLSKDLWDWCIDNGFEAQLAKQTLPHQEDIFNQLYAAVHPGYFKCPTVPIWADDDDYVHFDRPPKGKDDIFRFEGNEFIHDPGAKGGRGWYGSPYKQKTGITPKGKPKDDVIFGTAHAIFASNEGEVPMSPGGANNMVPGIEQNTDVLGVYGN